MVFSSIRWLPIIHRSLCTADVCPHCLRQPSVHPHTQTLNLILIFPERAQSIARTWQSLSYQRTLPFHSRTRIPQWTPAWIEFTPTHVFFRVHLNFILPSTNWPQSLTFRIPNELFHITLSYPMPHSLFIIHNKSIKHNTNTRNKQQ